tara:strand:+ start:212 stop:505 length:294 start_codon:yes stop_codon:yes gene_type:complete
MATYYKIVDGVKMEMTAEESAEREAIDKAFEDNAPNRNMEELRKQRNLLLAETDFYALGDVTMSENMKTYRQALRDITSQTPTDINLSNINWPTKPS